MSRGWGAPDCGGKGEGRGPPDARRGVSGQERAPKGHRGWWGRGPQACTHTSVCRVDGLVGLAALGVHKRAPNEQLVGHPEGQLVHGFFHLGGKDGRLELQGHP